MPGTILSTLFALLYFILITSWLASILRFPSTTLRPHRSLEGLRGPRKAPIFVIQFIIVKRCRSKLAKGNGALGKVQKKPGIISECAPHWCHLGTHWILPAVMRGNACKVLLIWEVHPSLGVQEMHWDHSHWRIAPSWLTLATPTPAPSQSTTRHAA